MSRFRTSLLLLALGCGLLAAFPPPIDRGFQSERFELAFSPHLDPNGSRAV